MIPNLVNSELIHLMMESANRCSWRKLGAGEESLPEILGQAMRELNRRLKRPKMRDGT